MRKLLFISLTILVISWGCKTKQVYKEEGDFTNQLTQQEIARGKLTPEILWKFGRVDDAHLSPDGKTIIYNVSRYDAKINKKHTWIFSVPSGGGEPKNLTADFPSCFNPRWLPDGKIAFLSTADSVSQIWVMDQDGSGKKQVSDAKKDINGFEFAATGTKLFYLQDVKLDSTTQDKYPDLPLAKGRIITDLMYRHWDQWHDYAYSHIFVSDYKDEKVGEGTDIMKDQPYDSPLPPYFDISEISWSPDGKMLAYSCKKLKGKAFAISTNSDVYVYHTDNGTTENITEEMMGYDRYPVFSPDSKRVAFQSMETPGYESDKSRLFVYDFGTKTKKYLTANFDQESSNYQWSDDGKTIYFISGIQATYQIYAVNVESDSIRSVTTGIHDYTSIAFTHGVLVGTRMSMSRATEIFRIDPADGKETQLTFTNKNIYEAIKTARVEKRWVKTTDNKEMLVWVILPVDFDSTKKYPALLYCEGGPQSAVSQFYSFRWNFQIMAANGYVIVAPNRRGLPTFGQQWNDEIA
ncbi:MAG TPA: prolyl oligopeptidase family serine peptidase, partial [Bacteroidales bacterium]